MPTHSSAKMITLAMQWYTKTETETISCCIIVKRERYYKKLLRFLLYKLGRWTCSNDNEIQ